MIKGMRLKYSVSACHLSAALGTWFVFCDAGLVVLVVAGVAFFYPKDCHVLYPDMIM
ncbi:MAG: hypothetical protein HZC45_09565 [Deltaproteobacteria bacterium]|nr:hypothetical protein [Deltaproteobacteria bacterium]